MALLKISDLSVGDWVEWIGERCKVDLPLLNTVFPHAKIDPAYTSATLQSISITPEILEKNGFRKNGKYNEWNIGEWNDNPFIGVSLDRQSVRVRHFDNDIFIEDNVLFVHQLQHALRLAGIEKDIEL